MKEYIKYFYNIDIVKSIHRNDLYFLESRQKKYMFSQCTKEDIGKYYDKLKKYLKFNKKYFEIIRNRHGSYLTLINGKAYVLLDISKVKNHKISISDIEIPSTTSAMCFELDIINYSPWIKKWEEKIDYFETWFLTKKDEYYEILDDFSFFIGLSENALLYLKYAIYEEKNSNDEITIQHLRIRNDTDILYYYNPVNIILDHPSRDIGEYIKSGILDDKFDFIGLEKYLNMINFSKFGAMMLYARVIFPNIFFDYIERTVLENKKIDFTYVKSLSLEIKSFLYSVSNILKRIYDIPTVDWIMDN